MEAVSRRSGRRPLTASAMATRWNIPLPSASRDRRNSLRAVVEEEEQDEPNEGKAKTNMKHSKNEGNIKRKRKRRKKKKKKKTCYPQR